MRDPTYTPVHIHAALVVRQVGVAFLPRNCGDAALPLELMTSMAPLVARPAANDGRQPDRAAEFAAFVADSNRKIAEAFGMRPAPTLRPV